MSSFMICLNAVIPIFLIIAVGYIAKLAGIVRDTDVARVNTIAFKVFMPAMCFYNIYSSDLTSSINPKLMVFGVAASLAMYALSWLVGTLTVKELPARGVVIQGLYRSNYLIVGVPFVAGLTGGEALGFVSVLGAVVIPLFNVLAVITLEMYSDAKPNPKKVALDIAKNPIILGSAAGIVFLLLGLKLPSPVETAVRDMARVASPLLLFILGAFLDFSSFGSRVRELVTVSLGRLFVIPAIGLTAAVLMGFRGPELVALISLFASSTALNSFTMAQQMGGDAVLAGNIVVVTNAACSLTLFLWSYLFKVLGLF